MTLDEATDAHLSRVASAIAEDVQVDCCSEYSNNPAASIVDYIQHHDVSLVVVASHGRSGVSRWLGGVADKVVQTSPVPIAVWVRKRLTGGTPAKYYHAAGRTASAGSRRLARHAG